MAETQFKDKEKPAEVRSSNIIAAKAVADAIRTSLGPKGMDKMIQFGKGEVVITNDGATILKHMSVMHPAAKMLVDLSAAQDVEAGDGTTSVVVLAGSLLTAAEALLKKGIHPTTIAETFTKAAQISADLLTEVSTKLDLTDRESLLKAATTSLNSKIVSQYSSLLSPIAVDSVLKVIDPQTATNVDLRDIRLVCKLGGTIDDTEMIDGLILKQNVIKSAGGPSRMEKAKIALVQFQLSPPKPDMDNQVVVNDYRQMDKILKEERQYLLNICKKIKKSGCNVLLIQKSILRDAVNDLSLHFLSKLKILAIKEIERDEVEFICKSTGCKPIADIDSFTEDKLGYANLVEEAETNGAKVLKITGVKNAGKCVSVLIRGANNLVLEEAERSLHDALCVIRCLVKKKALIAGGGAPEVYVSQKLSEIAKSLKGMEAYCFQEFANALEVIPTTLAENSGLNPVRIVTELRNRHASGETTAGINVRKGTISNILEENVIQPLLVSTSAIQLAAETFMCEKRGVENSLMSEDPSSFRVVVIGGGLVGSLAALQFANKGFTVDLFEKRSDIRTREKAEGRSINLALSVRGIEALKNVGVAHSILSNVIPMQGRFIHSNDTNIQPYGEKGQCINSVDRKLINEILLTQVEKSSRVKVHFEASLDRIDFDTMHVTIQTKHGLKTFKADLIVGTDGAYSRTRQQIMRSVRMDYSQSYIDHAYVELSMPPLNGQYQMDPNYLHIWPRETFMMIALPNLDKSFTVTLFMPWKQFDTLKTREQVLEFFVKYFGDAVPLIGQERLLNDYFGNDKGSLMTCKPYNLDGKAVILGDAAHAMVPFYGQGMNCGFEDVLVLDEIFTSIVRPGKKPSVEEMQVVLDQYSRKRNPDVEAMCDLALLNYVEMRDKVTKSGYLVRKKVEGFLNKLFPTIVIPLYTMVSFTRIPYKEALDRYNKQTRYFDFVYSLSRWTSIGMVAGLVVYKAPTIRSILSKLLQ